MITPTCGTSAELEERFFEGAALTDTDFRVGRVLFFMSADAENRIAIDYNDLSINHSLQANDDVDQLNREAAVRIQIPPQRRKDAKKSKGLNQKLGDRWLHQTNESYF